MRTLGLTNDESAKKLLVTACEVVKPIMMKRSWRVVIVKEFIPRNDRLLGVNVNRGMEVRIRLREGKNSTRLFPFEDIVGTLLHELVHNKFGRHDKFFYDLLVEIKIECENGLFHSLADQALTRELRLGSNLQTTAKFIKTKKIPKGIRLGGSKTYKTKSQRDLAA